MNRYTVRHAEPWGDEAIEDELRMLHDATFADDAPLPDFTEDDEHIWWLCYHDGEPVAFAGMRPSNLYPGMGYFARVGVLPWHRGRGLGLRLLRIAERSAKRLGWTGVVSDTTDNTPSANNFIRAGYRIFAPVAPWSFRHSIYWRKDFAKGVK